MYNCPQKIIVRQVDNVQRIGVNALMDIIKGDQGFSPTVSVKKDPNGITITVTDINGTKDYFIDTTTGSPSDYATLFNKPSINGYELLGNKTAEQLLLQGKMNPVTNQEIEEMFK